MPNLESVQFRMGPGVGGITRGMSWRQPVARHSEFARALQSPWRVLGRRVAAGRSDIRPRATPLASDGSGDGGRSGSARPLAARRGALQPMAVGDAEDPASPGQPRCGGSTGLHSKGKGGFVSTKQRRDV